MPTQCKIFWSWWWGKLFESWLCLMIAHTIQDHASNHCLWWWQSNFNHIHVETNGREVWLWVFKLYSFWWHFISITGKVKWTLATKLMANENPLRILTNFKSKPYDWRRRRRKCWYKQIKKTPAEIVQLSWWNLPKVYTHFWQIPSA